MFNKRKALAAVAAIILSVGIIGCENTRDRIITETRPQDLVTEEYRITITNLMDNTFANTLFFTPAVGVSHNDSYIFWRTGQLASPGVVRVAEQGATDVAETEIDAQVILAGAQFSFNAGGTVGHPNNTAGTPTSQTIDNVIVSNAYPLVSLVSMIAPSPDWFVGLRDVSLVNSQGEFLDEVIVDLIAYDAGSQEGDTFAFQFSNPATDTTPNEVISRVDNASITNGKVIGRIVIEKL